MERRRLVDPPSEESSSECPLHDAVRAGDSEAVNDLLNSGADISLRDSSGLLPFELDIPGLAGSVKDTLGVGRKGRFKTPRSVERLARQVSLDRAIQHTDSDHTDHLAPITTSPTSSPPPTSLRSRFESAPLPRRFPRPFSTSKRTGSSGNVMMRQPGSPSDSPRSGAKVRKEALVEMCLSVFSEPSPRRELARGLVQGLATHSTLRGLTFVWGDDFTLVSLANPNAPLYTLSPIQSGPDGMAHLRASQRLGAPVLRDWTPQFQGVVQIGLFFWIVLEYPPHSLLVSGNASLHVTIGTSAQDAPSPHCLITGILVSNPDQPSLPAISLGTQYGRTSQLPAALTRFLTPPNGMFQTQTCRRLSEELTGVAEALGPTEGEVFVRDCDLVLRYAGNQVDVEIVNVEFGNGSEHVLTGLSCLIAELKTLQ